MKRTLYITLFLTVLSLIICLPLVTIAAEPVKVAILPFKIHADKDYTFLQKGITAMLTSRLSAPGKVNVIDPVETEKALSIVKKEGSPDAVARQVATQLQADYAIHGSLTVLGESVSIDAKMIPVGQAGTPYSFFKQTDSLGDVIGQLNLMASDINSSVFGVAAAPTAQTQPPATGKAVSAVGAVGLGTQASQAPADIHMHPEKLLQQNQGSPQNASTSPIVGAAPQGTSSLNPAFQTSAGMTPDNRIGFWQSRTYGHLINSIDVGDVDKDGLLETVVATPEEILVYRFAQGRQQTIAQVETDRNQRNISVSIGDINGNGTPEIFVTAFTLPMNRIISFVMEYDGNGFKTIVEKSPFFYSVVHHPDLGNLLLGQHQTGGDDLQTAPIYEMAWKGAEYIPENTFLPGRKANVLGLTLGHFTGKDDIDFVALDWLDNLRIFRAGGKEVWKGDEAFGGTPLYYALEPKNPGDTEFRAFLPVRLRTADLDRNGKPELLTAANTGGINRRLGQQRHFTKSHIEALVWDGQRLVTAWKTRELSGRIQDLIVVDFDNDGTTELLAVQVTKEGAIIFTDAKCNLIAFDLQMPQ